MDSDGDVGDPHHTPENHHHQHGNRRLSRAPQDTRDAVGEGQQEVKQRDGVGLGGADGDYLGVAVEGGHQDR